LREIIDAKILGHNQIGGKNNPADIVSKHWTYPQVWHLLMTTLFYSSDTNKRIKRDDID
jgi:hypothetical protein